MTDIPDAAIEAAAERLDDLNVDGWIVVPDPRTGGETPMQEQVPVDYIARAAIEAAMPAIREHIAQEIEAGKEYETDMRRRATLSNAARIVRGGAQ